MNSKSIKDGIAGALITLILVFFISQLWNGLNYDHRNSFELKTANDLKQISLLTHMYYEDYEEWPANLKLLNVIINKLKIPKFKLPAANMYWEFDYLYYPPKVPIDKIDLNQIMLASPTHWDKNRKPPEKGFESFRIVAYYDGTVKKISEKEYQKQINHNNKSR